MADAVESPAPSKGPSLAVQVGVLVAMTAAALGVGWFSGSYLGAEVPAAGQSETTTSQHSVEVGHGEAESHGEDKEKGEEGEQGSASMNPLVLDLPTITTNLAAPSDTWLRLELSIQLDAQTDDLTLADTIHQDLIAFMRTVKLHQIEGASGFQHLRADLTDRAAVRSRGRVKAVLIRTLLFE